MATLLHSLALPRFLALPRSVGRPSVPLFRMDAPPGPGSTQGAGRAPGNQAAANQAAVRRAAAWPAG
ncbi:hypothetical protein [Pseudarthrobacter albicanus]|uniref:hypothetical protein n=1 Tax=Pseudarthrobacter albicanus TaxID=2823873 RepID=UPI001FE640C5|nr:hypothetical protein [Pseudarthrobacter albicanus]